MKVHYNHIMILITIFLLIGLISLALNKNSKYYGETHKMVFNDAEKCTDCHLYDKDILQSGTSTVIASSPTSGESAKIDDEYDYGEEDEAGSEEVGWFFGKTREGQKEEKLDLSLYESKAYESSGFVTDDSIIPHEFNKSHTDMCFDTKCHTNEELGSSHAVELSPYDTYPDMVVPEEIPLNWDTEKYQEVMTCGSCHNPHLDWLSMIKSYEVQEPQKTVGNIPYYKTYYLRIKDPVKGYATLCKSCHGEGY